jgi:hypothetical protein
MPLHQEEKGTLAVITYRVALGQIHRHTKITPNSCPDYLATARGGGQMSSHSSAPVWSSSLQLSIWPAGVSIGPATLGACSLDQQVAPNMEAHESGSRAHNL